jgi:hypothetical protein
MKSFCVCGIFLICFLFNSQFVPVNLQVRDGEFITQVTILPNGTVVVRGMQDSRVTRWKVLLEAVFANLDDFNSVAKVNSALVLGGLALSREKSALLDKDIFVKHFVLPESARSFDFTTLKGLFTGFSHQGLQVISQEFAKQDKHLSGIDLMKIVVQSNNHVNLVLKACRLIEVQKPPLF